LSWICNVLSKGRPPSIDGNVTDDGVPAIEVEVGGQRWWAIIDTGFNGELELAERLKSHVNAQFVGRVMSLLAASQRIEEDLFLVDFDFDGTTLRAQATFVDGDEILIGTHILWNHRRRIDFPAQTVAIERISSHWAHDWEPWTWTDSCPDGNEVEVK
jgi:predicted aspartyl protease